jgi:hypothetical protein
MKKKSGMLLVLMFSVFIGAFFVMNLIMPDRSFSSQENRALQQLPSFSLSSLFSGTYTSKFEKYAADQFAFRDFWIPVKARAELAIGKHENNGVYYCGDTLITRFTAPDYSELDAKLSAIDELSEKSGVPVRFALIPGAADIWSSKLPENAPGDSQKSVIDYCYSKVGVQTVDMYSALNAHADEYIYYRTDHHWTSLGAYYGYSALMNSLGLPCPQLESYDRRTVSESFYGTACSTSGFTWVKPDSIETFVSGDAAAVENYSKGPNSDPASTGLYVDAFLQKKDKYSMFLGGVTPLIQIETKNSDAPSLLIVRDSYTDSLAPFLTENFSNIYIVDLRYYKGSVSKLIKEKNIDSALVIYSVSNFCSDDNIVLLGM